MPTAVTSLFVAWQSPPDGSWFTVGKLSSTAGRYRYEYTKGVESAATAGFRPFAAFPDLFVTYDSERLFPFFENRLLSKSRREYADFVRWVSGHTASVDPVLLLGQSGGQRMTDSLELFPKPERDEQGFFHLHFFVHGLRHMPPGAVLRADRLQRGDHLLVVKDVQNPFDHRALMLRTPGTGEQDIHFLGYFPRYLAGEIGRWVEGAQFGPVRVLRTNPPPAPIQYRLLCCLEFHPPDHERLFESEEFIPLKVGRRQTRAALNRPIGKR